MQLLKFVPIKLTLFLVAGIVLGNYIHTPILIPLIAVLISIITLGILFKIEKTTTSIYFGTIALITTFLIGFLSITTSNPKNNVQHYANFSSNDAQELQLKILEALKPNEYSEKYVAEIISINNQRSSGQLILYLDKDISNTTLKVDDEILVYDNITSINAPLNPHQFNYKKYLAGVGILNQIQITEHNFIQKENPTKTIYGIAANFREHIIESLKNNNFGEEELSIIQALLLGQRNDISEETYTNYKNAGAVHILAVSGLHIGVLLLILQFVLQPLERLPYGNKLKLGVIVILLWSFAFIAGLSASVVRAVTMFSFLAYASYLNRPANRFNILALSLLFILLIMPTYLFQVGFQMSYAAVFAIIWIYPKLQRYWYPKSIFVRKIWQLMSVSIAAQIGVLPITLFYFHQFPSLFFISNLVIVPCLGLILGGGILVIILSLLRILPDFIVSMYNEIISLMNLVIFWVARQEAFVFKDISFDGIQLILVYILFFSLVFYLSKPSFKKITLFLGSIILLQAWSYFQLYQTNNTAQVIVLHHSRNTGILEQKGAKLSLLSNQPTHFKNIVTTFNINERIESYSTDMLANSYSLKQGNLYVIDSLAILPPKDKKHEYVLLTQSPPLNLERLIEEINPKIIIADGSNYKSDIERWKATCIKIKLPFHYTGEKGAYYFY